MRAVLIAAAGAASLLTAFAGAAQADERLPSTRVPVSHVDFRDPAAVKAFYSRLRSVARDVCASPYVISLQTIELDRACVDRAVAEAVRQVDHPLLTAMQQQQAATRTASGY